MSRQNDFGTIPAKETQFLVLEDIYAISIGAGHPEKVALVTVIGEGGAVLGKDSLLLWNDVYGWISKHPKRVIKGTSFNK